METSTKIKILYVDDEMNNLIGFKAALRFDYHILIAQNTKEAYSYLEKHDDIKVVFCDQKMPDVTGVMFFEEMRAIYPYPIRILLTAYADIEAVIDAINRGHVFRYVKKPWIDADIISAIEEGVKFYKVTSMLSIKNDELSKAYSELDKFAYSVSHDIRGPLVGLIGGIDLALDTENVEEIKEILTLMQSSVNKLDTFILNMHDYYCMERGELKIVNIDFNKIANNIKDIYNIYALSSNISFKISVTQTQDFWNDEVSISMIITNLISNAFKYQKTDFENKLVELDIKVEKRMAIIKVIDNGCGIDEKYISQIYNLFFRAHYKNAGSGFGLFNVKSALLKLNGKIDVESTVDEGTQFTVTIPNK
jgi:two-component system, sensor histidine kinase and response regulator